MLYSPIVIRCSFVLVFVVCVQFTYISLQNDADVFACAVNPNTSMVEAFDTYNPDGLSWTNKRDIDTSQVRYCKHIYAVKAGFYYLAFHQLNTSWCTVAICSCTDCYFQVASRNVCPRPGSLSFVNGTISCA